jgi:hypothetical protein
VQQRLVAIEDDLPAVIGGDVTGARRTERLGESRFVEKQIDRGANSEGANREWHVHYVGFGGETGIPPHEARPFCCHASINERRNFEARPGRARSCHGVEPVGVIHRADDGQPRFLGDVHPAADQHETRSIGARCR